MRMDANAAARQRRRRCLLKVGRKCCSALIALLAVEDFVGMYFVAKHYDYGDAGAGFSHNEILVDSPYPFHPKRNVTPYIDLCEDCRLKPSAKGRPHTCLDRAIFLRDKKRMAEDAAREYVIDEYRETCAMTRFPSPYSPEERAPFDSVFAASSENATADAPTTTRAGRDLSVYFYETLPPDMGIDLERHMAARYASELNTEENFKADLAIIELFRTYPGRTRDPQKADVLVVPFAHASHCLSNSSAGWKSECGHVAEDVLRGGVFDNLPYYRGNEKRHLFVNAQEIFHAHRLLRNVPLSLTLGPRLLGSEGARHVVVPYLNDQRPLQPVAILKRDKEWWTRPRRYSLAYFFGSQNKNMKGKSPRVYRTYFLEEVQRNWNAKLGGLPYVIHNTRNLNATAPFFAHMYSESVFCPTLPGDAPSQKRFFDAIVAGCLPVVLSFDTTLAPAAGTGRSGRSWHTPEGHPVEDVYPWFKGAGSTYPEEEIDYRSFVVEVRGGVGNVKPVLEGFLNDPAEVRRRQLLLRKYAPYFSYGVGAQSHAHRDAFSKILGSVRFQLSSSGVGLRSTDPLASKTHDRNKSKMAEEDESIPVDEKHSTERDDSTKKDCKIDVQPNSRIVGARQRRSNALLRRGGIRGPRAVN